MAILFEWYETPVPNNETDETEKTTIHARITLNGKVGTDEIRRKIQKRSSLTETDVSAVLDALSHVMGEELSEGRQVHLDGIGYFQVKLNSQEPITSPKLKANQIKLKANICFKADAKLKRSVSVVHVERSKLRNHSASLSNEKIDKLLTNYFNDKPMLTRIDFQRLCGFTSTTAARHIKRLKEEKKLNNIHTYYNPIYVPMPGYYGKAEIKEDETNAIK